MVKANTQSNKSKYLYIGVIVVRIQKFILICEFSLTFLGYLYQFPLKHQNYFGLQNTSESYILLRNGRFSLLKAIFNKTGRHF